jgi:hypothetical protein
MEAAMCGVPVEGRHAGSGEMTALKRIEPQPPDCSIKYMIGDETWLPAEQRTPLRLVCEEWGSLGHMLIDATIPRNKAGFDLRVTEIPAPEGARHCAKVDGSWFWTDATPWEIAGTPGEEP